jgi:hypothetical protein
MTDVTQSGSEKMVIGSFGATLPESGMTALRR